MQEPRAYAIWSHWQAQVYGINKSHWSPWNGLQLESAHQELGARKGREVISFLSCSFQTVAGLRKSTDSKLLDAIFCRFKYFCKESKIHACQLWEGKQLHHSSCLESWSQHFHSCLLRALSSMRCCSYQGEGIGWGQSSLQLPDPHHLRPHPLLASSFIFKSCTEHYLGASNLKGIMSQEGKRSSWDLQSWLKGAFKTSLDTSQTIFLTRGVNNVTILLWFCFGGHNWQCSGTTPSFVLRLPCGARDPTQASV